MALRDTLAELGCEPATWIMRNKRGAITGVLLLHVDDFRVGINQKDPGAQRAPWP